MEFAECPHERTENTVFPIVGLIRLSFRAVDYLLCQNGSLSGCLHFRCLTKPFPQIIIRNGNDTLAEFVFQATAFHYIFLIVRRVIDNQSLVDGDALL